MTKKRKSILIFLSCVLLGTVAASIQGCDSGAPVYKAAATGKSTETMPKNSKVRAIITVIQDEKHELLFQVTNQDGKAFSECQLCPSEYVEKNYETDRYCEKLRERHKKEGKTPICLTRSTPIAITPLTIGQSIRNPDCIWIPMFGTKILINPGCEH